jgi:hypothetical protein
MSPLMLGLCQDMELALWVSVCKFQSLFFEVLNAPVLKINLCPNYQNVGLYNSSRGSSVSIVSGYGLGCRAIEV